MKHPMDLLTMELKIKNSEYTSLEEFENDFNLMVSNCLAYNSKETIFYKAGIKMRDQVSLILLILCHNIIKNQIYNLV